MFYFRHFKMKFFQFFHIQLCSFNKYHPYICFYFVFFIHCKFDLQNINSIQIKFTNITINQKICNLSMIDECFNTSMNLSRTPITVMNKPIDKRELYYIYMYILKIVYGIIYQHFLNNDKYFP